VAERVREPAALDDAIGQRHLAPQSLFSVHDSLPRTVAMAPHAAAGDQPVYTGAGWLK
jgi:hypothetical protein